MKKILYIFLMLVCGFVSGQKKEKYFIDSVAYQYALIEASRQKMIGDINMAVKLYNDCIKSNPECAVAYYELGTIYKAFKEYDKAEGSFNKAFGLDPDNYWYGLAYSDILSDNKKYDKALSILKKMSIKNKNNSLTLNIKIAEIYSEKKQYSRALKIIYKIEKENGFSEMVSLLKIDVYRKMKDIRRTEEEIKNLVKRAPDYPGYQFMLAEFYTENKDTLNAIKSYEKSLELDSTNIYAISNLAELYLERKDKSKAFYFLNRAFENNNIEVENKIKTIILFTKDTSYIKKEAKFLEELVNILLVKYPDNYDVKTVSYDFYNMTENHLKALDIIKQIINEKNDVYILWIQAIYHAGKLEKYDEIIDLGERALRIFPNKADIYLYTGMAYFEKNMFEKAYSIFNNGYRYIKDLSENKIQYVIFLAESAYKINRKDEAFKYFDELIKTDPENLVLKNNYSYYLALEGIELEKAKKLSSETILKDPENSTYLDTYGWILFELREYEEAKTYIEKALKFNQGNNPEILFHLAEILSKLNMDREAKDYYLKSEEYGYDKEIIKMKVNELDKCK